MEIEGTRRRRPKGTGSVRHRDDGRWQGRIGLNGRYRVVYGYSEEEAEAKLRALRGSGPEPTHRMRYAAPRATALDYATRAVTDGRDLEPADLARLVLASIRPTRVSLGVYGPCVYCGDRFAATVDHVIPRSMGGTDDPDNVVSACSSCNGAKHDQTLEQWRRSEA